MEGIAKTAMQVNSAPVIHQNPDSGILQYEDVPLDVYRYFSVDIGSVNKPDTNKLRKITEWAYKDGETPGDVMQKIRSIEIKLGQPATGQKRYDKIYNWVALQMHIEDLHKRQEALRGAA